MEERGSIRPCRGMILFAIRFPRYRSKCPNLCVHASRTVISSLIFDQPIDNIPICSRILLDDDLLEAET